MAAFIDLTGRRFGRLTALSPTERRASSFVVWLCRCDCGTELIVSGGSLRAGNTKSCGCLHRERTRESASTHGMSKTPIYRVWKTMRNRCQIPTRCSHNYLDRGITVCDRWQLFENFLADMGERPSPQHSIERIDNDRGYEPSNCCWATRAEQSRNRRNNVFLELNGKRQTQSEWARELGISQGALLMRLKFGWPVNKALTAPKGTRLSQL